MTVDVKRSGGCSLQLAADCSDWSPLLITIIIIIIWQANINEQQYEVVSQSSSQAVIQYFHRARQSGSARQDQICQRVATALKTLGCYRMEHMEHSTHCAAQLCYNLVGGRQLTHTHTIYAYAATSSSGLAAFCPVFMFFAA